MSDAEARKVLGINDDGEVTQKKLKNAYRIAVKMTHPDVNDIDDGIIKSINEAYSLLDKKMKEPSYNEYVTKKISYLKDTFLGNRRLNIKIYEEINDVIKKFYHKALNFNDFVKFDDEFNAVKPYIVGRINAYKQRLINSLEKDYIVNEESKKLYDEFVNVIELEFNIDNIEKIYLKTKEDMKVHVGKELYINEAFLNAKKSYLYKYYIGNLNVEDKDFQDEEVRVKGLIDKFISQFNDNDTIEFFNILIVNFYNTIGSEYKNFINDIYDKYIDNDLNKKYSFVSNELFRLKIKMNKQHNLNNIYYYYINIPYVIKDTIKDNIKYKLDRVINNNKENKYYKNVSYLIDKKYEEILNIVDVESDIEYENDLEEYILFLISKYGKLDIKRERLLSEALNMGIDNRIISDLKKASELDKLEKCLMDAGRYIDSQKKSREKASYDLERQRNISSMKGLLNLRMVSSLTYNDEMKKIVSDKIRDILDKYSDKKIDDISSLKKIFFKDFNKDCAILDRIGKEDVKVEQEAREKHSNNIYDEDFDVINEMFKSRDLRNRKEKADKIYETMIKRYELSRNISDSHQKREVLYKVISILNDYVHFNIDDISGLDRIRFENYYNDLNIIYDIYDRNNKDVHHNRR